MLMLFKVFPSDRSRIICRIIIVRMQRDVAGGRICILQVIDMIESKYIKTRVKLPKLQNSVNVK